MTDRQKVDTERRRRHLAHLAIADRGDTETANITVNNPVPPGLAPQTKQSRVGVQSLVPKHLVLDTQICRKPEGRRQRALMRGKKVNLAQNAKGSWSKHVRDY